jgi:hypothetical protein
MKYTINRMDGRFSYRNWFQYYIGFAGKMSNDNGPVDFDHCLRWFTQTYGWSAEIRQYADMHSWTNYNKSVSHLLRNSAKFQLPDCCNPNWSWSNGFVTDLRIYVKGDQELSFFQLAIPVDR